MDIRLDERDSNNCSRACGSYHTLSNEEKRARRSGLLYHVYKELVLLVASFFFHLTELGNSHRPKT